MDERNRRILALLSHPSRVQLIELLGQKALQTDEMAAEMPIELAGTVVHLNYLINEGVVHSKRFGRRVKYWLDRERFAEALSALGESVGIRVSVNRSFKQEAPSEGPDLPVWPKEGKKTPKTRLQAKKSAKASKSPARTKKKTAAKKTSSRKASPKKTAVRKAPARKKSGPANKKVTKSKGAKPKAVKKQAASTKRKKRRG